MLYDETLSLAQRSRALFAWLIAPITIEEFYDTYFEKKPLFIRRRDPMYYSGWLSTADIKGASQSGDALPSNQHVTRVLVCGMCSDAGGT